MAPGDERRVLFRRLHHHLRSALDRGLARVVDLVEQHADLARYRGCRRWPRSDVTMAEYQNIFTQVQVAGSGDWGMDNENNMMEERVAGIGNFPILGWFGNAQLGPIYLGYAGVISIFAGFTAFFIIGLNMLSQVDWSVIQFLRQGFWLALEPPSPEYGLQIPPLHDGGWYMIASFFLLVSVWAWWARTYMLAVEHKMGKHIAWAFLAAIWLFMVLGFFRPILMGSW
uniref:Photosynthetic reaction centre M subunit n=1 Tax=Rhodovulum marinum TaxID=320662 RepID=B1VJK8_9RHOB|nr:photosynthetic reaction centre M subunit [Rhodovulum marinum]